MSMDLFTPNVTYRCHYLM